MARLFGTDGVRGLAGVELTADLALRLGSAAAQVVRGETGADRPVFLIGQDTRLSSDMLAAALTAGLCAAGADAVRLGVLSTPAVAQLVREHGAQAGVMISASHNPFEDNGIKFFNARGFKLRDEDEDNIEALLGTGTAPSTHGDIGRVLDTPREQTLGSYINKLAGSISADVSGYRIAVDCANGSASATAPALFKQLGVKAEFFNVSPDGKNINDRCGATHLGPLCDIVAQGGYDGGFAFDGDADRFLAVDEHGKPIDGDILLAIFGEHLRAGGKLPRDTIVATVMSNLGLIKYLAGRGISVATTKVGDRYVLEEMVKSGYAFGGEQSGHFVFYEHIPTGDGQLSALMLLEVMRTRGVPLSQLAGIFEKLPQVLINVRVARESMPLFATCEPVQAHLEGVSKQLEGRGRVLVRPSGTEPLIRVMVEGEDEAEITALAEGAAATIKENLK